MHVLVRPARTKSTCASLLFQTTMEHTVVSGVRRVMAPRRLVADPEFAQYTHVTHEEQDDDQVQRFRILGVHCSVVLLWSVVHRIARCCSRTPCSSCVLLPQAVEFKVELMVLQDPGEIALPVAVRSCSGLSFPFWLAVQCAPHWTVSLTVFLDVKSAIRQSLSDAFDQAATQAKVGHVSPSVVLKCICVPTCLHRPQELDKYRDLFTENCAFDISRYADEPVARLSELIAKYQAQVCCHRAVTLYT